VSADQAELNSLQAFHTSALERTGELEQLLINAQNRQEELTVSHQQEVKALEATHSSLNGQLETLTVEKAELSARLATEQQHRTEAERELQEARRVKETEVAGVKGTYDRLIAALQGEISQKEIALHQAKQRLVVSILDRVLFPSGQATLTSEGQRILQKVGAILANVTDRRILIEGHTDNMPISPALITRFPTNWELSTARATEVVKHLIAQAHVPADRLSAAGRADTAPVAANTTTEGRAQNRRIEIILLPPEEQTDNIS
jgi:chemotaxis protein MotB